MLSRLTVAFLLVALLAGCGNPARVISTAPIPPPTPAVIDVPAFLFSTMGRDITVTVITDLYDQLSGAILRTAHPNGGTFDARDHYQADKTLNCVKVHMVDTYQYDPDKTWLHYQQEYPTFPCWVGSLSATVGTPVSSVPLIRIPYYWRQFDKDGNQIGADFTGGLWSDHTTLLCTAVDSCHLTEYYDDHTPGPVDDDAPYCVQGDYDLKGLAKLSPGNPILCQDPK